MNTFISIFILFIILNCGGSSVPSIQIEDRTIKLSNIQCDFPTPAACGSLDIVLSDGTDNTSIPKSESKQTLSTVILSSHTNISLLKEGGKDFTPQSSISLHYNNNKFSSDESPFILHLDSFPSIHSLDLRETFEIDGSIEINEEIALKHWNYSSTTSTSSTDFLNASYKVPPQKINFTCDVRRINIACD